MADSSLNIYFSESSNIDTSINLRKLSKIYFTPTTSNTKMRSTLKSNNGDYYYNISTIDNGALNNGVLTVPLSKNTASFSYSAVLSYLIDLQEESIDTATNQYARFFSSNDILQPGISNLFRVDHRYLSDIATAVNTYISGLYDAQGGKISGVSGASYFTDTSVVTLEENRTLYSDLTLDASVKAKIKKLRLHVNCTDTSIQIPNEITVAIGGAVQTISKNSITWQESTSTPGNWYCDVDFSAADATVFTLKSLWEKIITHRSHLFANFYSYCAGLTSGQQQIPHPAYCDMNAVYPGSFDDAYANNVAISTSITHPGSGYDNVYTIVSNPDRDSYLYTSGYRPDGSDRFFKDASISGYKNYIKSSIGNYTDNNILDIPVVLAGDDAKNTGIHVFREIFMVDDAINITVSDDLLLSKLNASSIYIDNIEFQDVQYDPISDIKLRGNAGGYEGLTCGSVINTLPWMETDGYKSVNITDSAVRIVPAITGYNSGVLSNIGYLNNSVVFDVVVEPTVEYITGSLKIDGYSATDINGAMNNVLDSNYHMISIKVKNTTNTNIMISPEIFNIVTQSNLIDPSTGDSISPGEFINVFGNVPNNNCNGTDDTVSAHTAYIQPLKKTYAKNYGANDPGVVFLGVRIKSDKFIENLYNVDEYDSVLFDTAELDRMHMTDAITGTDVEKITKFYIGSSVDRHQFWKIPADGTADITYLIKRRSNASAKYISIFCLGLIMLPYYSADYDYDDAHKTIVMFNNLTDDNIGTGRDALPTFIQLPDTSRDSDIECKYIKNDENIINIGDEIDTSYTAANSYIVINRRTGEIVAAPAKILVSAETYKLNADLDGLCLGESDLIIDLSGETESPGVYKYIDTTVLATTTNDWLNI